MENINDAIEKEKVNDEALLEQIKEESNKNLVNNENDPTKTDLNGSPQKVVGITQFNKDIPRSENPLLKSSDLNKSAEQQQIKELIITPEPNPNKVSQVILKVVDPAKGIHDFYSCPECPCIPTIKLNFKDKSFTSTCLNTHQIYSKNLPEIYSQLFKYDPELLLCEDCKKKQQKEQKIPFIFCNECKKYLCDDCKVAHNKSFNDHHILIIDALNSYCIIHKHINTFYCEECKINRCPLCEEHKKHKKLPLYEILPLEDDVESFKELINAHENKLNELDKTFEEIIADITKNYHDFRDLKKIQLNLIKTIIEAYEKNKFNYNLIQNVNSLLDQKNELEDIPDIKYDDLLAKIIKYKSQPAQEFGEDKINPDNLSKPSNNSSIVNENIMNGSKFPFDEGNRISIEFEVKKKIINKDIYLISDMSNNQNDEKVSYDELSEKNCDMYLDGSRIQFSKKLKFQNKGKHIVKYIIKPEAKINSTEMMFHDCIYISSVDLTNFEAPENKSCANMFCNCESLRSVEFGAFSTENVTDMSEMFANCKSLIALDLSGFSTNKVKNMSGMFCGCESLKSLDISNFVTNSLTEMHNMFSGCTALSSIDLLSLVTNNVKDMSELFSGCTGLKELDISNFNTGRVTNMSYLFSNCKSLVTLNLGSINTVNVTNMSGMFSHCQNLTDIDLSVLNTKNVTIMTGLFRDCKSLNYVDLRGFSTNKVKSMDSMFKNCKSLSGVDLEGFNTRNVSDMSGMFGGCKMIKKLDLSSFDMSKVSNLEGFVSGCENLKYIKLTNDFNENCKIDNDCFKGIPSKGSIHFGQKYAKKYEKILKLIPKAWEKLELDK